MSVCSLNSCDVTNNLKVCKRCYSAFYCCQQHQLEDWKLSHKQQCHPIPESVKSECKQRELFLHRSIPNQMGVYFRSKSIEEAGATMLKSDSYLFESTPFPASWNFNMNDSKEAEEYNKQYLKAVSMIAQAFLDKEFQEYKMLNWYPYLSKQHQCSRALEFSDPHITLLKAHFPPKYKSKISLDVWYNVCKIVSCYAQKLPAAENNQSNLVYLNLNCTTSLLNHSCQPNCQLILEQDQLTGSYYEKVVSQTQIRPGDELTISYAPFLSFRPSFERQAYLLEHFHFVCQCQICSVEEFRVARDQELIKFRGTKRSVLSQTETKEDKQNEHYQLLTHRLGMHNRDIRIIKTASEQELNAWILDAENFINEHQLSDQHWQAHNLRLWSVRVQVLFPNRQNRIQTTINARHAMETLRKTIRVNSILLRACEYLKQEEFSLFETMGKQAGISPADIIMEICQADPCFEYFQTVWFDRPIQTLLSQNSQRNSSSNMPQNQHNLETKDRLKSKLNEQQQNKK